MKRILTQEEARLLRFPATNGTDVVFSYAGDLWTVPIQGGEARRLTSHIGYELFARYSPDGKQIVFRNRTEDGFSGQLWTVSPDGGMPAQVPLPEVTCRATCYANNDQNA